MLEHKFYFDELYDRVFYAPSVALAQALYRAVEKPLVLASAGDLGSGVRSLGRRVAHTESGLIRLYALLIAAGLVVILVVFLAVQ